MTLDELREYRKKSKEQEAHEEKLRLAQYAAMQSSLEHMRLAQYAAMQSSLEHMRLAQYAVMQNSSEPMRAYLGYLSQPQPIDELGGLAGCVLQ